MGDRHNGPCTGVCWLNDDNVCIGCRRSVFEIFSNEWEASHKVDEVDWGEWAEWPCKNEDNS